jgi:hypothetical protein
MIDNIYDVDADLESMQFDYPQFDWYRRAYRAHSKDPVFSVRKLMEKERRTLFPQALAIVRRDLMRQEKGPSLEYAIIETLRPGPLEHVVFDLLGNELYSLDLPSAEAEVAEILQSEIIEREHAVWPVCPVHNLALSPKTVEEHAVWWCKGESHSYRQIGDLPQLA